MKLKKKTQKQQITKTATTSQLQQENNKIVDEQNN